jgi:hypothetical protein
MVSLNVAERPRAKTTKLAERSLLAELIIVREECTGSPLAVRASAECLTFSLALHNGAPA